MVCHTPLSHLSGNQTFCTLPRIVTRLTTVDGTIQVFLFGVLCLKTLRFGCNFLGFFGLCYQISFSAFANAAFVLASTAFTVKGQCARKPLEGLLAFSCTCQCGFVFVFVLVDIQACACVTRFDRIILPSCGLSPAALSTVWAVGTVFSEVMPTVQSPWSLSDLSFDLQAGACAISFFSIRRHLVSHQFAYLSGGFHHTFLIKGTGCGFRILSTSFSLFMNLAEGLKSFSTRIHLLYSCFAAGFSPSRFSFGRFMNHQMSKAFSRWCRLPPAPFWLPTLGASFLHHALHWPCTHKKS